MRRIRYRVAMSLDGYIAGPHGEFDWIVPDPEVDFAAIFSEFDAALIGRRTFEMMVHAGRATMLGMKMFVFSRTLRQRDYPGVTIVADKEHETVASLREKHGKDIWLFGGSALFQSLLQARLVDTVEVSVVPVLLGGGIPLLPAPADRKKLELTSHKIYKSGTVSLQYAVK
ncbi:MAG: dihydrofolate reductase family protein [Candidatus Acidiferrales bacterium]